MKKFIFLLLTSSLLAFSASAQTSDYTFFEGSYDQLQTRALNSSKPYFVLFYASWSLPAKRMFTETFSDPALVAYASENYLGMALDGESVISEGAELAEKYNVMYFPSILIFTPEGKLLKSMPGFTEAGKLLATLRQYRNEHGTPEIEMADAADDMQPVVERPGEYLFKVSAKVLPRTGYGVQVGVYSNYRNAFEKLLELENEYFHKNVLVFIKDNMESGELMYKVILGPFSTEDQAAAYQELLKAKDNYYTNSLKVDLTNL